MALFAYLRHELAHGERTIGRFDLNDGSDIRIFVDTSIDSLGGTYWTRENSTGNDFPKQYLTNSRQSRISKIQLIKLESEDQKLRLSHEMSGFNGVSRASSLELFRMDRPSPIAIVPASICYAGRNDGDAEWAQGNFF